MTEKIKKLEQLTEDVHPEFPTLPSGGYVEDVVDQWLSKHLGEVNQIIQYQNYGVDLVDAAERELEGLKARNLDAPPADFTQSVSDNKELEAVRDELARVQAELKDANHRVGEAEYLRAELAEVENKLAHANARNEELQAKPAASYEVHSETMQASILLQHATELGAQFVEKAKEDGEQIRRDAVSELGELRAEIEEMDARRFATFRSLEEFFRNELQAVREHSLFADFNETLEDEEAGTEDYVAPVEEEEVVIADVAEEGVAEEAADAETVEADTADEANDTEDAQVEGADVETDEEVATELSDDDAKEADEESDEDVKESDEESDGKW